MKTIGAIVTLAVAFAHPSYGEVFEIEPGTGAFEMTSVIDSAGPGDTVLFLAGDHDFQQRQIYGLECNLAGETNADGSPASRIHGTSCGSTCSWITPTNAIIEDLVIDSFHSRTIFLSPGARLAMRNCHVLNGGGIFLLGGGEESERAVLDAQDCRFFNCGGIESNRSTLTLSNCSFVENNGGFDGGALNIGPYGSAQIADCLFERNAASGGAGMYVCYWANVSVSNCVFAENSGVDGQAISCCLSTIYVNDSLFCGHTSPFYEGKSAEIVLANCVVAPSCDDCNNNSILDYVEILDDSSQDCDTNGTLDACEIEDRDCNNNGSLDICDVENGAIDVDQDGIPDSCQCRADMNQDGMVDAADLGILVAVWGTDGSIVEGSDLDGDGEVQAGDLGLLIAAWGVCP